VRLHEMVAAAGHVWPANGLRHSFATYHSAMFGDWARLQSILGHKDAGTLHQHYRGLATRAEARKFWALRP
jgi:integrase